MEYLEPDLTALSMESIQMQIKFIGILDTKIQITVNPTEACFQYSHS